MKETQAAGGIRPGTAFPALAVSLLTAVAAVCLSVATGSVSLPLADLFSGLSDVFSGNATINGHIVSLRLSRTGCAFVTGAALSLSGVFLQTLFKNPLADPYVTGISSAASFATLAALTAGLSFSFVQPVAFAAALSCAALLYLASQRELSAGSSSRMLLTGVVLAFSFGAGIVIMLTALPGHDVRGVLFWLSGELSGAAFVWWHPAVVALALIVSLKYARALNAMVFSFDAARSFGVDVAKANRWLFAGASFLTALSVCTAGNIAFAGLIVPHVCRLIWGHDMRRLLVSSCFGGAAFIIVCDVVARSLVPGTELPLGAVTAVLGCPVFVWQLYRRPAV